MSVIHLEKNNLKEIIESNKIVVVDFFANWCGPCKMLSPVIEDLSNEMTNVTFLKVNVDNFNEIASEFQIMSIPAIIIFKDGKVVGKSVGFQPKDALKKFISQNM